jgi:hypothetical protein
VSIEGIVAKQLDALERMAVEIDTKVTAGKASTFEQYKDWTGEARGIRRAKEHLHEQLRKGLDID